jgi:hypothetical protein
MVHNQRRRVAALSGLEELESRLVPSGMSRLLPVPIQAPAPTGWVQTINNPFSPLIPGTTFYYQGTKGGQPESDLIFVTHQTQVVNGVTTTVVEDKGFINSQKIEDTFDFYAQDTAGNVWYFGENTTQYSHGHITGHVGSWMAGVNGAQQGIVMEANPMVGDVYAQENAPGIAQDMAKVLSLTKTVKVPYGTFSNCLETKEFSPLEPNAAERKFYATGVGFLKSFATKGGQEVLKLVDVTGPSSPHALGAAFAGTQAFPPGTDLAVPTGQDQHKHGPWW